MNFTELDEMIASNDSVIELNSDIIKETNEFNEYLFLYKTNSEEFDQHFYDATTEIERITVDRRRFREIDDDIEFIDLC